jgi:hypothetical protein
MIGSRSTTRPHHRDVLRLLLEVRDGRRRTVGIYTVCAASTGSMRWLALGSRRAIPAAALAERHNRIALHTNVREDTAAISAVGPCRSVMMTASHTAPRRSGRDGGGSCRASDRAWRIAERLTKTAAWPETCLAVIG